MGVLHVDTEDGEHDLGLVAVAVGEGGAQRAVGEATGQDGLLARATFTTEERTGDLAGGVGALFHVDREREEVDAVTHGAGGVGGGEHGGAADCCDNCAH